MGEDIFSKIDISRRKFVEQLARGVFVSATLLSFPRTAMAQAVSPTPAPTPTPTPTATPSIHPTPTPTPIPSLTPPPPRKVTLCHKGHTITVDALDVPAHLAHGDTLGPCPSGARS